MAPPKDVPWFQANIGSSLTEQGRRLLQQYSNIPDNELNDHVYRIVSMSFHSFVTSSVYYQLVGLFSISKISRYFQTCTDVDIPDSEI